MKSQDIENKLIDYLDGALTVDQRLEVEQQLAASPELQQSLEELKILMGCMDDAFEYQPSEKLQQDFDVFLEKEKNKLEGDNATVVNFQSRTQNRTRLFFQIASAAAILMLGIFVGQNWNNGNDEAIAQIENLRGEMLSLLQEKSTSGRIKAVNISYEIENPDDEIVSALIQTMNIDGSINVRLSAIEALYDNFSDNPKVRTAFCETLNLQNNPMIQISLIKALVNLKEKKAEKYLQDLIKKENTSPEVRDEAQMGIFKMM